jgi:low affinity Fe/Cu permease
MEFDSPEEETEFERELTIIDKEDQKRQSLWALIFCLFLLAVCIIGPLLNFGLTWAACGRIIIATIVIAIIYVTIRISIKFF